eukprot:XP_001700480.1 predicted protein [Chlamydomonas reinhardtii]
MSSLLVNGQWSCYNVVNAVQQLLASPALANATGYLEGMVAGGREGLAELVQDTYLADIGLPQYVELMRGQEVTPLVLAGMKDRDLEVASVAGDGHVATVGAVGTGGAVAAVGGGPGVPPAATAAAAAPGMLDA